MKRWLRRVAAVWRSSRIHDEIDEELQFHIDRRVEDNIRSGMSPDEARAHALVRFGPRTQIHEEGYEVRGAAWSDALLMDIRHAARVLTKQKGFTIVAVLTLALGIGANVAIWTLVNTVLVRPLPFRDPDRLVRVLDDLSGAGAKDVGMSVPEFEDLRDRSGVFEQLAVIFPASTALSGGDRVERIELLGTTPNYFELLGASAALGRVYRQAEWMPGFLDGAVISDGLWKRQFGGDPNVIGRRIRVDEDAYTIIGVMPPDFHHPGQTLNGEIDIWAAAGFSAPPFPSPPTRGQRFLPGAIGRLKVDLSLELAQQRLHATATRLQRAYPRDYPAHLRWSVRLEPAQTTLTGNVRPTLVVLLAAVSFVLLMVCVNIASLLIARSSARSREFAVRRALGATRGRLVRHVLIESLLLALAGGAAAVFVLVVAQESLLAMMPADLPRLAEVRADWWTPTMALALAIVTGVLFGLAPALFASAFDPNRDLKEGGRTGGTHSLRQSRSRAALVMLEIALSVVLLTSAGLLMRSFSAMLQQKPGLDANGLVSAQIWIPVPNNPQANRYLGSPERAALERELLRRLGALPGVEKAALGRSNDIPFLTNVRNPLPFSFTDAASTPERDHAADFGSVTPGYFDALGISLKHGRVFTDHDAGTSSRVVVVNEAFVRTFSGQKDPVGRPIRDVSGSEAQIVGVVGDVRDDGLDATPQPHVYTSLFQNPTFALAVFLRTSADLSAVQQSLTRTIRDVDPDLPVFGVRTMDDLMSASMARRRFALRLMSVFAAVALLLAAAGVYGVMAFVVGQRRQEFSVRLALGAQARDILVLVFRPGLQMTAGGIAVGLIASIAVTRLMSNLLFGVSAADPLTFIIVPVLLGLVALVASFVPARRAASVDPSAALRTE